MNINHIKFYVALSLDQVVLGSSETGSLVFTRGSTNFSKIYSLVSENINNLNLDIFNQVKKLADIRGYLAEWSKGSLEVDSDNHMFFKGMKVPPSLTYKLLQVAESESLGLSAWYNFLQKLSDTSHEDTYSRLHEFLRHNNITINDEGNVLAWKVVTADFKDCYTRSLDNSVGATVSIPRQSVEHNVNRTCSRGLHACAFSYVEHFGGNDSRLVLVEIDVRDIVSVPTDYDGAKVRCCKYKVLHDFGFKSQIGDKGPYELLEDYEKAKDRDWVLQEVST